MSDGNGLGALHLSSGVIMYTIDGWFELEEEAFATLAIWVNYFFNVCNDHIKVHENAQKDTSDNFLSRYS
jgi:hypothetical protein